MAPASCHSRGGFTPKSRLGGQSPVSFSGGRSPTSSWEVRRTPSVPRSPTSPTSPQSARTPVSARTPASARSRRAQEDSCLIALDPSGHPEKFPRPSPSEANEALYSQREVEGGGSTTNRQAELNAARERCAPRQFLWTTLETVALRPPEVASNLPLPLAAVCAPFADVGSFECPVVGHVSQQGPVRCPRCMSYINAFFAWSRKEDRKLQCNMCSYWMEAPDHFLETLEQTGGREDRHPELTGGSVDFPAPAHLDSDRPAKPTGPAVCVALETSPEALLSGLAFAALDSLEHQLAEEGSLLSERKVCLLTFGDAISFFVPTISGRFSEITMGDLEDPFCPVEPELLFTTPAGDEGGFHGLAGLLQQLREKLTEELAAARELEASEQSGCSAGLAAYRLAVEVLSPCGGGDLLALHANDTAPAAPDASPPEPCSPISPGPCSSPATGSASPIKRAVSSASIQRATSSIGFGGLTPGGGLRRSAAPSEVDPFTEETLALCLKSGVAVSVVTAPRPSEAVDVAKMQWLAWRTGGDAVHLPGFGPQLQPELEDHLWHWVRKAESSAYSCVFRLRCSKGLTCRKLLAPWPPAASAEDGSAFELPRMSPDTTATFMLSPEYDQDDEDDYWASRDRKSKTLYVQAVVLHTNSRGQRLLRVHNTAIHVVNSVRQVFTGISLAPLMAVMLKQACLQALGRATGASKVLPRDFLLEFCLQAISSLQRHCNGGIAAGGSLVVNRRLCLLPLYVLAARKLMFYLTGGVSDKELADQRLRSILRMPVHSILSLLYPRIYSLPGRQRDFCMEGRVPGPDTAALSVALTQGSAEAYMVHSAFGSWLHLSPSVATPEATEEIWRIAHELNAQLREHLGPSAAHTPLRWLPRLSAGGEDGEPSPASTFEASSWEDKVLLSTLLVEDAGATEMPYGEWVQFLQEELARNCGQPDRE